MHVMEVCMCLLVVVGSICLCVHKFVGCCWLRDSALSFLFMCVGLTLFVLVCAACFLELGGC